jgi:hypothetical protein
VGAAAGGDDEGIGRCDGFLDAGMRGAHRRGDRGSAVRIRVGDDELAGLEEAGQDAGVHGTDPPGAELRDAHQATSRRARPGISSSATGRRSTWERVAATAMRIASSPSRAVAAGGRIPRQHARKAASSAR